MDVPQEYEPSLALYLKAFIISKTAEKSIKGAYNLYKLSQEPQQVSAEVQLLELLEQPLPLLPPPPPPPPELLSPTRTIDIDFEALGYEVAVSTIDAPDVHIHLDISPLLLLPLLLLCLLSAFATRPGFLTSLRSRPQVSQATSTEDVATAEDPNSADPGYSIEEEGEDFIGYLFSFHGVPSELPEEELKLGQQALAPIPELTLSEIISVETVPTEPEEEHELDLGAQPSDVTKPAQLTLSEIISVETTPIEHDFGQEVQFFDVAKPAELTLSEIISVETIPDEPEDEHALDEEAQSFDMAKEPGSTLSGIISVETTPVEPDTSEVLGLSGTTTIVDICPQESPAEETAIIDPYDAEDAEACFGFIGAIPLATETNKLDIDDLFPDMIAPAPLVVSDPVTVDDKFPSEESTQAAPVDPTVSEIPAIIVTPPTGDFPTYVPPLELQSGNTAAAATLPRANEGVLNAPLKLTLSEALNLLGSTGTPEHLAPSNTVTVKLPPNDNRISNASAELTLSEVAPFIESPWSRDASHDVLSDLTPSKVVPVKLPPTEDRALEPHNNLTSSEQSTVATNPTPSDDAVLNKAADLTSSEIITGAGTTPGNSHAPQPERNPTSDKSTIAPETVTPPKQLFKSPASTLRGSMWADQPAPSPAPSGLSASKWADRDDGKPKAKAWPPLGTSKLVPSNEPVPEQKPKVLPTPGSNTSAVIDKKISELEAKAWPTPGTGTSKFNWADEPWPEQKPTALPTSGMSASPVIEQKPSTPEVEAQQSADVKTSTVANLPISRPDNKPDPLADIKASMWAVTIDTPNFDKDSAPSLKNQTRNETTRLSAADTDDRALAHQHTTKTEAMAHLPTSVGATTLANQHIPEPKAKTVPLDGPDANKRAGTSKVPSFDAQPAPSLSSSMRKETPRPPAPGMNASMFADQNPRGPEAKERPQTPGLAASRWADATDAPNPDARPAPGPSRSTVRIPPNPVRRSKSKQSSSVFFTGWKKQASTRVQAQIQSAVPPTAPASEADNSVSTSGNDLVPEKPAQDQSHARSNLGINNNVPTLDIPTPMEFETLAPASLGSTAPNDVSMEGLETSAPSPLGSTVPDDASMEGLETSAPAPLGSTTQDDVSMEGLETSSSTALDPRPTDEFSMEGLETSTSTALDPRPTDVHAMEGLETNASTALDPHPTDVHSMEGLETSASTALDPHPTDVSSMEGLETISTALDQRPLDVLSMEGVETNASTALNQRHTDVLSRARPETSAPAALIYLYHSPEEPSPTNTKTPPSASLGSVASDGVSSAHVETTAPTTLNPQAVDWTPHAARDIEMAGASVPTKPEDLPASDITSDTTVEELAARNFPAGHILSTLERDGLTQMLSFEHLRRAHQQARDPPVDAASDSSSSESSDSSDSSVNFILERPTGEPLPKPRALLRPILKPKTRMLGKAKITPTAEAISTKPVSREHDIVATEAPHSIGSIDKETSKTEVSQPHDELKKSDEQPSLDRGSAPTEAGPILEGHECTSSTETGPTGPGLASSSTAAGPLVQHDIVASSSAGADPIMSGVGSSSPTKADPIVQVGETSSPTETETRVKPDPPMQEPESDQRSAPAPLEPSVTGRETPALAADAQASHKPQHNVASITTENPFGGFENMAVRGPTEDDFPDSEHDYSDEFEDDESDEDQGYGSDEDDDYESDEDEDDDDDDDDGDDDSDDSDDRDGYDYRQFDDYDDSDREYWGHQDDESGDDGSMDDEMKEWLRELDVGDKDVESSAGEADSPGETSNIAPANVDVGDDGDNTSIVADEAHPPVETNNIAEANVDVGDGGDITSIVADEADPPGENSNAAQANVDVGNDEDVKSTVANGTDPPGETSNTAQANVDVGNDEDVKSTVANGTDPPGETSNIAPASVDVGNDGDIKSIVADEADTPGEASNIAHANVDIGNDEDMKSVVADEADEDMKSVVVDEADTPGEANNIPMANVTSEAKGDGQLGATAHPDVMDGLIAGLQQVHLRDDIAPATTRKEPPQQIVIQLENLDLAADNNQTNIASQQTDAAPWQMHPEPLTDTNLAQTTQPDFHGQFDGCYANDESLMQGVTTQEQMTDVLRILEPQAETSNLAISQQVDAYNEPSGTFGGSALALHPTSHEADTYTGEINWVDLDVMALTDDQVKDMLQQVDRTDDFASLMDTNFDEVYRNDCDMTGVPPTASTGHLDENAQLPMDDTEGATYLTDEQLAIQSRGFVTDDGNGTFRPVQPAVRPQEVFDTPMDDYSDELSFGEACQKFKAEEEAFDPLPTPAAGRLGSETSIAPQAEQKIISRNETASTESTQRNVTNTQPFAFGTGGLQTIRAPFLDNIFMQKSVDFSFGSQTQFTGSSEKSEDTPTSFSFDKAKLPASVEPSTNPSLWLQTSSNFDFGGSANNFEDLPATAPSAQPPANAMSATGASREILQGMVAREIFRGRGARQALRGRGTRPFRLVPSRLGGPEKKDDGDEIPRFQETEEREI